MWEQWPAVVAILLTIIAAVWSQALWISGQFTAVRNLIYTQVEKLSNSFSDKLEYHERHDDTRFNNIAQDLMEIKLRNAAIRGLYLNTDDEDLTPVSKKVKKLLKEDN